MRSLRLISLLSLPALLVAQLVDPGKALNAELAKATNKKFQLQFEMRQRAEYRTGQLFGRDRDLAADYIRFRIGATYRPKPWLKISGLAQDTRAPFYGLPAPGNVRDPFDLQEGYFEIFSEKQRGFGFTAGRQMLAYGDTRLIGSPQWAYAARTWDNARLFYVMPWVRLEAVFLSTIVPRGDSFNKPVLGDRIWGTYNTFRNVAGKHTVDAYILRHDQNRPGGFTGVGTVGINVFGSRWALQLPKNSRFTAEPVVQTGKVGLLPHRAFGFSGQFGHRMDIASHAFDSATEYKYASGSQAGSGKSGLFDQLYPAAHDKMGHADLLGWKNVHNIRSTNVLTVRRGWTMTLMYDATWLANKTDGVYNLQSRLIARDPTGRSGRYVGQEVDLFTNFNINGLALAGGIGQFFPGRFIRNTTPGAHSRLLYLSTGYSF